MDLKRAESEVAWFLTSGCRQSAPIKAQSYEPMLGGGETPAPDERMVSHVTGRERAARVASAFALLDGYSRWILDLAFRDAEGCAHSGYFRQADGRTERVPGLSSLETAMQETARAVGVDLDAAGSPRIRSGVVPLCASAQQRAANLAGKNDLDHVAIATVLGDAARRISDLLPTLVFEVDAIIDEALVAYIDARATSRRDQAERLADAAGLLRSA